MTLTAETPDVDYTAADIIEKSSWNIGYDTDMTTPIDVYDESSPAAWLDHAREPMPCLCCGGVPWDGRGRRCDQCWGRGQLG
jgi:hypothetical protein